MKILKTIQEYWRLFLAFIFVLVGTVLVSMSNSDASSLLAQENTVREEIQGLEVDLNQKDLTKEDLQPEVEIITEKGVHVRDMGEEMIEAQLIIAEAYKTPDPLADDADLAAIERAEATYTRLTDSTDYANAWVLNSDWSMTLDSVGTYADVRNIPVVFSMYMDNGELAGVVRGTYDSDRDLLSDIVVDYTVNGFADMTDPGGA